MLDVELVRYLAFAAFGFFLLEVVASIREKRKSGKLKKSVGIGVHPVAKVGWMMMLLALYAVLIAPPFYPGLLYWNLISAGSGIIDALQAVGFALMIGGALLFFSARRALGRFMVPEIMVAEGHRLVTEGPYRRIRHPAYTSSILVYTGLSLFYMNPVLGLLTIITATTAVYRARKEEELLTSTEAFGKEYLEYKEKTGMFLPKLATRQPIEN